MALLLRFSRSSLTLLRHLSISANPTNFSSNPNTQSYIPKFYNSAQSCGISVSSTDVDRKKRDTELKNKRLALWIELYLPEKLRPYAHLARLDKPVCAYLLAWPCMWSITLAAAPGHFPDLKMMTMFSCGAFLLCGAGCTINDLLDRDIDAKVERTKSRPIASGALKPFQGFYLLVFNCFWVLPHIRGFIIATRLCISPYEKDYILASSLSGLTYNWGALLGWSEIRGSLDPAVVVPLYLSGVFWTLVYDTIYAHQDKEDDKIVGVKSTALRFGDSTKMWVSGFGIACISSLALSGFNANLGLPYYVFLAAASGQLAWQIWTLDISSTADCARKFVSNQWFGALVFGGILMGRLSS